MYLYCKIKIQIERKNNQQPKLKKFQTMDIRNHAQQEPNIDEKVLDEYMRLSALYQDKYGPKTIVLYQIGKFYEVYGYKHPDHDIIQGSIVEEFADVCDLKFTAKKMTYQNKYPVYMAGIPVAPYQLEKYKGILLENQYTIVLYVEADDQSTNTKQKKIRKLEGVYSPGTYIPEDTTSFQSSTHIVCIWIKQYKHKQKMHFVIGAAIYDLITNKSYIFEYEVQENKVEITTFDELERILTIYRPKEVILISEIPDIKDFIPSLHSMYVHELSTTDIVIQNAEKQKHCDYIFSRYFDADALSQCLEIVEYPLATQSFVVLLNFLEEHNPVLCKNITLPEWESRNLYTKLANHTLIQLNILDQNNKNKTLYSTFRKQANTYSSVYSLLDRCKTSMGSRLFFQNLTHPTCDEKWLNNEYSVMDGWLSSKNNLSMLPILIKQLSTISDMDHILRLIHNNKLQMHQMYKLYCSLASFEQIWTCIAELEFTHKYAVSNNSYNDVQMIVQDCIQYIDDRFQWNVTSTSSSTSIDCCTLKSSFFPELHQKSIELIDCEKKWDVIWMYLEKIMNPSNPVKEGFIKRDENDKRGSVYFIMTQARFTSLKKKLRELSKTEIEWCSSNIGLDISLLDSIPSTKKAYVYLHSPYLQSLSNTLQEIHYSIQSLTQTIYQSIISELETKYSDPITLISNAIGRLDVLWCKCVVARDNNYCCPRIVTYENDDPSYVQANGLRHVLIEKILRNECYVPNDIEVGTSTTSGILLFGTNAVGKTSLMRALGIAVIMAQAGMYVPCSSFVYKPYKSIFSRILSQDNLFKGQSTFAVEMAELRIIGKYVDSNSLILGDELCSGTESTSALCIMMATLNKLYCTKASFLLATHFHEITNYPELEEMTTIKLCHLSVLYNEEYDCLEYERILQPGSGNTNYGLEVCKSLHMTSELMEYAYSFRSRYFPEYQGSLQYKSSRYNSEKIKGKCEMCGKIVGDEIHHIEEQQYAKEDNGFIGTIHKNHMGNLMSLCESCHDQMHDTKSVSPLTQSPTIPAATTNTTIRKIKTTGGYKIKKVKA